ncbi:MAG: hypothetical protein JW395_1962 [Nitrospira sp.]|nr:hypothetical protein [Nitrospira sp.]
MELLHAFGCCSPCRIRHDTLRRLSLGNQSTHDLCLLDLGERDDCGFSWSCSDHAFGGEVEFVKPFLAFLNSQVPVDQVELQLQKAGVAIHTLHHECFESPNTRWLA